MTNELLNAERPGLPPPSSIHYAEKHVSGLGNRVANLFCQAMYAKFQEKI